MLDKLIERKQREYGTANQVTHKQIEPDNIVPEEQLFTSLGDRIKVVKSSGD